MTTSLVLTWSEFGRRTAVVAGMAVALLSLIADCPLWVASARGVVTIIVLVLLVRGIAGLLVWSSVGDREESLAKRAASNQPARVESDALKLGGRHG